MKIRPLLLLISIALFTSSAAAAETTYLDLRTLISSHHDTLAVSIK